MKQMEHKQFDAIITDIQPQGIIKAVFSVFGNVDHGGDKIHAGAFAKTFAERGQKVLVLDNHNTNSTGDVIAKTIGLRELSREQLPYELQMKYPDATGGAELTAKFEPDKDKDPKSAAAFYRLKNNWLGEWSFGYDPLDFDFEQNGVSTVRNIRTIKLYEVSPVLWGMNGATMTTDAKADDIPDPANDKSVWETPYKDETGAVQSMEITAGYTKAGAVLNARNVERLNSAIAIITEILTEAGVTNEAEPAVDEMMVEGVSNNGPLTKAIAPTPTGAGPQSEKTPEPETKNYLSELAYIEAQLALLEV